jgi:1-aminocyclopropane-1-carboxylate deaminase/D-cysteine desulfhydrase-like pyridoxal-dependent ACC family enzyme
MFDRVYLEELVALRGAPRVALGQWPTPLVEIEARGLPKILVKRDDLSGWGRGGAKARKIEHLIGYMMARGYSDLVTVAGNVTNLAFDLLPAMDRFGLGVHLHIIDDPPTAPALRTAIFGKLAPRLTLLGPTRAEAFRTTWQAWFALKGQGRRPLWVLPGVSHPSGVIGNALGYLELADQLARAGRRPPRTIFVTAATGTTLAGFALAERLLRSSGRPPTRIVGAQIYPGRMRSSARWLSRWAGLAVGGRLLSALSLDVSSAALCGGFARFDSRLVELCARVGHETGLEVDPIFGGKTWSVMEDAVQLERPRDAEFLYWHCGFTPEWQTLGQGVEPA